MNENELTERKRRLQTMVTNDLHRRVKAAAAIEGQTIEQWLESAATEKLFREARATLAVVRDEVEDQR